MQYDNIKVTVYTTMHTIAYRIASSEQSSTRWSTQWLNIVVGQYNAIIGQSIKVGCRYLT